MRIKRKLISLLLALVMIMPAAESMICFADGDTLYENNFDSGDVSDWIVAGGTWTAADGKYKQSDLWAVAGLAYTGDARWSNYTVEADAHVTDMGTGIDGYNAIGFTVGFNDYITKKYIVTLSKNIKTKESMGRIGTSNGGATAWETDASATPALEKGKVYHLKAEMANGEIALYADGVQIIRKPHTEITAGKVGFFAANCTVEYDNFTVCKWNGQIEPTEPPSPTESTEPGKDDDLIREQLFADDFTSGDLSQWISEGGTWQHDGTRKSYVQNEAWAVAALTYTGDSRWSDYEITADITPDFVSTGISGRNAIGFTVGFNDYITKKYIVELEQNMETKQAAARIGTSNGGATVWEEESTDIKIEKGRTYKLRSVMYKGEIALYLDSQQLIRKPHTEITAGKAGLFAANCIASFDNVVVNKLKSGGTENPTPTPTVTPAPTPTPTDTPIEDEDKFRELTRTELMSADFDSGSADGWTAAGGTWETDSAAGTYNQTDLWAVAGLSYIGDARWKNYEVLADVKVLSKASGISGTSTVGFTVGFNDYTTKKYIVDFGCDIASGAGLARIGTTNSGPTVWEKQTSGIPAFKANQTYRIRAIMYNGEIVLFVDDKLCMIKKHSEITAGRIGLFAANCTAAFDNVKVNALSDGSAPPEEDKLELPQYFDFEDGKADGWAAEGGTWTVDQTLKAYKQIDVNAENTIAYIGERDWSGYSIEADVQAIQNSKSASVDSNWSIGLVVGLDGSNNRHVFSYAQDYKSPYQNKVFLASRVNSPSAVWSTYTTGVPVLEIGKTYHIKAVMNGGAIKLYIDDMLVASKVSEDLVSGMAGLTTSHCSAVFDNIVIKNIVDVDITADETENVSRKPGSVLDITFSTAAEVDADKIKFTANSVPIDSNTFSFVKKDSTHYQLILNKWLYENTEYRTDFSEALKGSNGAALSSNILVFSTKKPLISVEKVTLSRKNADGSYTDITNAETGTIRITAKIKAANPIYAVMIAQSVSGEDSCFETSYIAAEETVMSGTNTYVTEVDMSESDSMIKLFFWTSMTKSERLAEALTFKRGE